MVYQIYRHVCITRCIGIAQYFHLQLLLQIFMKFLLQIGCFWHGFFHGNSRYIFIPEWGCWNLNMYIVWLSLIWDTDWLNTVTWSTNISVCCPPQSCGGGTLIDTTHFFTQTNGKLRLRYYRFKHVCWPS